MSQESRIRGVALRWLTAIVVGAVVAGTTYLCAYLSLSPNYNTAWYVRYELDELERAIEKHHQTTGRFPAELAELDEVKGGKRFRIDGAGRVVDRWERPYQYRVEGETVILYSYGRDGQPGGVGLDADIYPKSTGRGSERPTLWQFTFDLPTADIQRTCLLAGVCAGLICFWPARNRSGGEFLVRAGATAIGTVFIAVAIIVLHIASGH